MKNNEEARDRFYKEVGIHLAREGFSVMKPQNGLLPIEWNGASLCRITAGGGAQFRRDELEPEGAGDAFQLAKALGMGTVRIRQGIAKHLSPSCDAETPAHTVDSLSELLDIL